jgi:hypothetical protein
MDDKRGSAFSDESREGGVDLGIVARICEIDLLAESGSRRLHLLDARLRSRIGRVDERRQPAGAGPQLMQQPQPLCTELLGEVAHAGQIAARPIETGDQTKFDRVAAHAEHDRNRRCRGFGSQRRANAAAGQSDDIDSAADEIGDQCRQALVAGVAEAVFDRDVVALDVAGLRQTLAERHLALRVGIGRAGVQVADHRHRRLLRARGERPSDRTADERDELATSHSITSSARC